MKYYYIVTSTVEGILGLYSNRKTALNIAYSKALKQEVELDSTFDEYKKMLDSDSRVITFATKREYNEICNITVETLNKSKTKLDCEPII